MEVVMWTIKRKYPKVNQEKSPYLLQHAYNPVAWHLGERKPLRKHGMKTSLFSYLLDIADLSAMMYLSLCHDYLADK
jgi:hypothetical protein